MPNELEQQIEATIEPNVREDATDVSVGFLFWAANAGQIIAPWWSKTRDQQLRAFWKDCDYLSSAFWMIATKFTSVPFHVEPRDLSIKSHVKQAVYYDTLLHDNIEFGLGWEAFWFPFLYDLWTQDNGAFGEVLGDGKPDGPIEGPAFGVRHLDSWRCTRTSNPIYPVIYMATSGKRYKLHYTRTVFSSQAPSPAAEMNRVGHCWTTRAVNKSQELIDILTYKQEKLGSRPPRQILVGKGLTTEELVGALRMSGQAMDDQGLSRFSKTAVVGSRRVDVDLTTIDLASVPDGFDERTSIELGMYLIALAGGVPPRWIWPATTTGATKADALYSHIAGTGGGASWHLNLMANLLGGSPRSQVGSSAKLLPAHLRLVLDYQDDEQDRATAEIHKVRADYREKNLNTGVTTVRVERERMLSDGELTEPQFRAVELEDGRLPDGDEALTLFLSEDPVYQELLDLGVGQPLAIIENEPVAILVAIDIAAINATYVMLNAPGMELRIKAENAIAALGQLKEIYEGALPPSTPQEEEGTGEFQDGSEGDEGGTDGDGDGTEGDDDGTEGDEGDEGEPPDDVKGFNFGARVGEVIRGALARGQGGQFANAADLAAQRQQAQARVLSNKRDTALRSGQIGGAAWRANLQAALDRVRGGGGKGGAKKKPKPKAEPKPKKGGGGGAKKLTPEEKKRQQGIAQAQNRARVFAALNVAQDDLDALHAFLSNGQDLDTSGNPVPEREPDKKTAARLIDAGLLKIVNDQLISTPAARALLAAAKANNTQRAREALATAKKEVDVAKSASGFQSSVNSAIRGLWSGQLDQFGFVDTMISAIDRNLREAWINGAAACGIKEDELTTAETNARDDFINGQFPHLPGFASDIEVVAEIHRTDSRDPAGRLTPLLARGTLWTARYQEAFNKAKAMACADKKLKWTLGQTEHCTSCLKLSGKVKRASFWNERGVIPRVAGASYLECGGWKCGCDLYPTDDPLSKGPLPNLP